ncbi:unnamed protein product [Polarella glacialis]|uniref:Pentacotripeptide-repeat region of PRORP domain-containing protein n=1 Tax=Polarella glacialis TaxID=89957 RepID=A0A813FFX8_POLGL|nr:unnamed protein product [Polarella glacialis]
MCQEGITPNEKTFGKLMEAAAKVGEVTVAEGWLRMHVEAGFQLDMMDLNTMAASFAKLGDLKGAERWLFDEAGKLGLSPTTTSFNILMDLARDTREAESWLERMESSHLLPDLLTYNTLMAVAARGGGAEAVSQAAGWFEKAQQAGCDPDLRSFNSILNACASCGDAEQAKVWLSRMQRAGFRADTLSYGSLISSLARQSEVQEAERYLQISLEMRAEPDIISYTEVINAMASVKNGTAAAKWLTAALDAAWCCLR